VLWARFPGFPPWPGRLCSQPEEKELIKKTKMMKSRPGHYSVSFMGYRLEKYANVLASYENISYLSLLSLGHGLQNLVCKNSIKRHSLTSFKRRNFNWTGEKVYLLMTHSISSIILLPGIIVAPLSRL